MGIKTGKKALFTEINITPLTDIFLVLLIIMMVVAPTFQSVDNTITIPEVNSGNAIEQGKVVVSVTKDGTIYVDSKRSGEGFLVSDLEAVRPTDKDAEIVVKADEKVKSSVIMEIMDAAQEAQYKKLIVAGEPLNKKDQKKLEDNSKNDTANYTSNNTIEGAITPIPQESQFENWSN